MTELLPTDRDDLVAYRVAGRVSEADFDRVAEVIEKRLDVHDTLRILAVVESIGGMDPEAFVKDLRMTFKHYSRFERAAIVTDLGWLRTLTELVGSLAPGIEVKVFPTEERDLAESWVKR